MDATQVKATARCLGAQLCGIADAESFSGAPEGFAPVDVLPGCRAVVVVAKRFNTSVLKAATTVPYTVVRNDLSARMNTLAVLLADALEENGHVAVPLGCIGPDVQDHRTNRYRGVLSLKHAAELAGLGRIGKNTLLVNERFGNMIWLNAVLTDAPLAPDRLASFEPCPPRCRRCSRVCPVGAIRADGFDQVACAAFAFGARNGDDWRILCNACRSQCPQALGLRRPHASARPA